MDAGTADVDTAKIWNWLTGVCDISDAVRENSNTKLYSRATRQSSFKLGMGHVRYMLSSYLVCSLVRFKQNLIKLA